MRIDMAFLISPLWMAISELAIKTLTSSDVPVNSEIARDIICLASFAFLLAAYDLANSKNIEHLSLSWNDKMDDLSYLINSIQLYSNLNLLYNIKL